MHLRSRSLSTLTHSSGKRQPPSTRHAKSIVRQARSAVVAAGLIMRPMSITQLSIIYLISASRLRLTDAATNFPMVTYRTARVSTKSLYVGQQ